MSVFRIIFFSIPVLTILWWIWAHRRMTRLDVDCVWKLALNLGMGCITAGYIWLLLNFYNVFSDPLPEKGTALVLLWGILFLPMVALPMTVTWAIFRISRKILGIKDQPLAYDPQCCLTRRKLLGSLAILTPVVAAFGTTAYGLHQVRQFRIRKITVELVDLPAALDGMTIAHLTDTHVGKFCYGKLLDRMADAINQLKPDLTLFTGDLIDRPIRDLPEGLQMLKRIKPRSGIFMVEGNHDIADDKQRFHREVRESGVPFLYNEAAIVRVRNVPVQLLGIRWNRNEERMNEDVDAVAKLLDPSAFSILLAHHPHAFDQAEKHGIPLTLAGHTHGGQLMLTDGVGAGPLLFRYWSGFYRKGRSALVVSNGAGNWFPLRVHAPAEIIHLTLKRPSA